MIHKTNSLYGHRLAAADGDIGQLKDFYFDDVTWAIRYLVADTGSWLTGRPVLFSPRAMGRLDPQENTLHINLEKKQIQNSTTDTGSKPPASDDKIGCCRYYGWPASWESDVSDSRPDQADIPASPPLKTGSRVAYRHLGDKHLQSTQTITDFKIKTVDGIIGSLNGFIVDDNSWTIREMIVETGQWFSGQEIMLSPAWITRINPEDSTVHISLSKEDIKKSVNHFPGQTIPKHSEGCSFQN